MPPFTTKRNAADGLFTKSSRYLFSKVSIFQKLSAEKILGGTSPLPESSMSLPFPVLGM